MAKPQKSQSAIVKETKNTSLVVSEEQRKAEVIAEALRRFAEIEGRGRELTDGLRDTYLEVIMNHRPAFTLRQIEKGMRVAFETLDKFPWPANLLEAIEDEV